MHKQIIDLISRYKGDVEEQAKSISIVAVNTLYYSYNDEVDGKNVFVENKSIKVECRIDIEEIEDDLYHFSAGEATNAIIGGLNATILSWELVVEETIFWLGRLNFQKRKFEQLALF